MVYHSAFEEGASPVRGSSRGTEPSSQTEDDSPSSDSWKMYQIPFHGVEIVDPWIDNIDVTKWTGVHSDNSFLQKLLGSISFYEFPFFPMFHKDLTLDDMLTGRRRFCISSPRDLAILEPRPWVGPTSPLLLLRSLPSSR